MTDILTNLNVVGHIDLNKSELRNARVQNLGAAPSSPVEGQIYHDSVGHKLYIFNGTGWVTFLLSTTTLDAIPLATSTVDLNNQRITNLATPTGSTDAVTKAYADSISQGVSWKNAVKVATTAAGTLASSFANGQTVDGVTLATGDRILIKNQASGSENGIYIVAASGAPTRATDADSGTELVSAAVFVTAGTANADTAWVCTTDSITLGTTSVVFVQFNANSLTFSSGVQQTGNSVTANVDGTTIYVSGGQLAAKPGGVGRKYVGTITGDGSTTSFTITHSLNSKDVVVQVRGTTSPYNDKQVICDVSPSNVNSVAIAFATAPASGVNFSVTVQG